MCWTGSAARERPRAEYLSLGGKKRLALLANVVFLRINGLEPVTS
jgi:hypothetical protein